VLPRADTPAFNLHLAEISKAVAEGAHAVVILDGAGYHGARQLELPENLTLIRLPPYAPELNSAENIWEYLRKNKLANSISKPTTTSSRPAATRGASSPTTQPPSPRSQTETGPRSVLRAVGMRPPTRPFQSSRESWALMISLFLVGLRGSLSHEKAARKGGFIVCPAMRQAI